MPLPDLTRHALRTQVRATSDDPRRFEAVVLTYGVEDDYHTIFDPGCFAESLAERLPRITWAHSWAEPLGRYVDFRDTDETLTLIGEFDDFDAVPRARQAYAQLLSGTIDQFSVGFRVHEDRMVDDLQHFVRCTLDEAALVLVGAVPGTKLVGLRSGGLVREVPIETLVALAKQVDAGELTQDEAQAALDLAAGTSIEPGATVTVETGDSEEAQADAADILDEADMALDALGL